MLRIGADYLLRVELGGRSLRYERAAGMTLLSKRLGIDPNSRMTFVMTKYGIQVWDLELEIEYTIGRLKSEPVAAPRPVPGTVKAIFELSNDELKALLSSHAHSSWDDEQTSIASELAYRGIKVN